MDHLSFIISSQTESKSFVVEHRKLKELDTISLRATRRSSVRLAPKIPNYVINYVDYDPNRHEE